jgi:hydroxyethylthiazole kinase-like uncharacterized protein yjeF
MAEHLIDDALVRQWVRAPGAKDHKYSRGVLGLMIGSREYPGAALLGTHAALRSGIGMVRFRGPTELSQMVLLAHPEVVVAEGVVDAWVIGSGIPDPAPPGVEDSVLQIARTGAPVVLDAGGLAFANRCGAATLLTPHSGELGVACERAGLAVDATLEHSDEASDLEKARALATDLGQSVLVKGSITRVVDPEGGTWLLPEATPWLATAGTGDVLAGIIGALVAAHQGVLRDNPALMAQAGAVGAMIHQRAAARAAAVSGQGQPSGGPITPSDVCEQSPAVIAEILSG